MKTLVTAALAASFLSAASWSADAPVGPVLNRDTLPLAVRDLKKDAESLRQKLKDLEAELARSQARREAGHEETAARVSAVAKPARADADARASRPAPQHP